MPSATQRSGSALDVIKEEQGSHHSSININNVGSGCVNCVCKSPPQLPFDDSIKREDVEKMLQERDTILRKQFESDLSAQISLLKERFDFILQNEQIRTSYMLREAHRERQEKIQALQSQLECKNMAGLMYVMCAERRRGKLEKLRLIEEYTGYIRGLQAILTEGQQLILNLSRGYKTAARVDHEWREKMKKIIKEFQAYVINYNGGTPESNQYIFDIPHLLKTKAPIEDDPKEDPCQEDVIEEETANVNRESPWWERLDGDCKPFIVFGDMAEFTPPQRRKTLRTVKAAKTAPKKWKDYLFNEMYLQADCSNLDVIKDEHPNRFPMQPTWECHAAQTLNREESVMRSRYDFSTTRFTSMDTRGNMGSILKIVTAAGHTEPVTKANLLGARDSMEITSTTKLKEKHSVRTSRSLEKINVVVGQRKYDAVDQGLKKEAQTKQTEAKNATKGAVDDEEADDDDSSTSQSLLGSVHNDSLQVITSHRPDRDHTINYEKVCPMEKCKHMQVDSFMRSLPPYMRASPFLHFEQTFEDYETCSPEQIAILQARLELKKKKHKSQAAFLVDEDRDEWAPEIEGVGVQTSERQLYLPPCTCELPAASNSISSGGVVFRIEDLLPIKKALDDIQEKCFFDDEVEFNRFQVIGQDSDVKLPATQDDFDKKRMTEIYRILKKHPSLCDLFQANTS